MLAGSILFTLLQNVSVLAVPWILKLAIDSLKNYPYSNSLLIRYCLLLVGVSIIGGIFRFYMRRLLIGVSRKMEYSIRADFFNHLQRLDCTFFESNRTGSIMALMTNDLDAVRNFLGPGLLNLFNTIFIFISTLAVMFSISVKLTLYSLIAIPLLQIVVSRLSAMLYRRFRFSQEQYASLSARTQENIAGIKVIKSFTQEENEIKTFSRLNYEYINKNMALARIRSIFWPMMILVGGIGSLVVLWVGGLQVINGVLKIGQFVQFSAYILAITWPLISLGWVINLTQRGEVSMGRLNKILKMQPAIKSPEKPAKINRLKGHILFKDVFFKYPKQASYELYQEETMPVKHKKEYTKDGFNEKVIINPGDPLLSNSDIKKDNERWILKKINFEIQAGIQLGIVGFTGSGKSTVVNLIPRLYDPQRGIIFIDGTDIRKISLDILRSSISYVTQDPFIFSKTIRQNIIFGKEEEFSKFKENELTEKIINASRASHLDEDIRNFPLGYDTLVGERGVTLSGGQKQRLAIARALITGPSVLILDDSFSSIDTNTEALILDDLKTITQNLTTIIISHRISTIKDSDLIIVMDDGEIVETGNHGQLLKKCGIYQRLHERQQLSEELEEEI